MHVVLEGPDNAGKTTLARRLQRLVPELVYFHPGGPPKTLQDELDCIDQQVAVLAEQTPHLIDRITPISQSIYNPDPAMNKMRLEALKQFVRRPDVLIVYCRPSMDRLLRMQDMTWAAHDTEEMKQKVIRGQHNHVRAYDQFMTYVPCLHFNYEDDHAEAMCGLVAAAIGEDRNSKGLINRMIIEGARP